MAMLDYSRIETMCKRVDAIWTLLERLASSTPDSSVVAIVREEMMHSELRALRAVRPPRDSLLPSVLTEARPVATVESTLF